MFMQQFIQTQFKELEIFASFGSKFLFGIYEN